MKAQLMILVVLSTSALTLALTIDNADSDDAKCRADAQAAHVDQYLDKVGPFKLYGPPDEDHLCYDVCLSHNYTFNFNYRNFEGCCCANWIKRSKQ